MSISRLKRVLEDSAVSMSYVSILLAGQAARKELVNWNGRQALAVEKIPPGNNFLIIYPGSEGYIVDVHSGTIDEPSTEVNAVWSKLRNKEHNIADLKGILRNYKIIK